jgi:hypothetical protein
MRAVLFSVLLAACAHSSGPRPINVHAVRVEIKETIADSPGTEGPRSIVSMGRVTSDSAVVYTDSPTSGRHEETWTKASGHWQLQSSRDVAAR